MDQIDARERDFDELHASLRFTAEQRAQLAKVRTAILRTKQRVTEEAHALQRNDPRAG
jgi:hypothetical protein